MHPFIETMSIAGAIGAVLVAGVMVLQLFYNLLSWLAGKTSKPESMLVRGVLKKDSLATVHLAGGETYERVRFLGFTSPESMKMHLPGDLHDMVILEDEQKNRYLVRAKNIRTIVVPADKNAR